MPAACFVFGRWFAARGERGWTIYSVATGIAFLGAFVLASAGLAQVGGPADLAGLFQRAAIIASCGSG